MSAFDWDDWKSIALTLAALMFIGNVWMCGAVTGYSTAKEKYEVSDAQ